MRDAMALQRRRRLMLLQSQSSAVNGGELVRDAADESQLTATGIETEFDVAALDSAREQLFRECQGRRGMHLLVEFPGVAQPVRLDLDRPFLLIGRDPDCDLQLDHFDVSSRQVYLQWVAGHLFCTDLVAEAGPRPGRRTPKANPWVERQPLQFGPCRLTIIGEESDSAPAFSPLDRSPQLAVEFPQVRLKFDGVEQSDNQWPVDRPVTLIGRGSQCKLRLNHPDMPLVLASLLRTPSGCWLIDLAGQGTTLVNGRPVSFTSLDIGDVLQLGPFRVTVTAAAFGAMGSIASHATSPEPDAVVPSKAIVELATRHRELLGELNEGLSEVQSFLDAEPLDEAPQLKASLEHYVRQASRHHREMVERLETLANSNLHDSSSPRPSGERGRG
ncbi:MAG: FHA domain-containing protein [Planctomycetota bacterium]